MAMSLVAACNSSSMATEREGREGRERKDVVSCFFSNVAQAKQLIWVSHSPSHSLRKPYDFLLLFFFILIFWWRGFVDFGFFDTVYVLVGGFVDLGFFGEFKKAYTDFPP